MKKLEDKYLLECYTQAVQMELESEFIEILREEIKRRKLVVPTVRTSPLDDRDNREYPLSQAAR